jgi:WD40 repeat protein
MAEQGFLHSIIRRLRGTPRLRPLRTLRARYLAGTDALAFSADSRWLTSSGDYGKTIHLWDVATGRASRTLKDLNCAISALAFTSDGHWLGAGSVFERTVKLWDFTAERELPLGEHTDRVSVLAFSRDGRWLASGSTDGTIKLWDVTTGREAHTLRGHSTVPLEAWVQVEGRETRVFGGITALAFAPDGQSLASGGCDKLINVWELATGRKRHALTSSTDWIAALAFSPTGGFLASGAGLQAKIVRLWDVATGHEKRSLPADRRGVSALAFSPDGRWVVCGIKVWDLATAGHLYNLQGEAHVLAFSADGRWLASGGPDRYENVWLWELPPSAVG